MIARPNCTRSTQSRTPNNSNKYLRHFSQLSSAKQKTKLALEKGQKRPICQTQQRTSETCSHRKSRRKRPNSKSVRTSGPLWYALHAYNVLVAAKVKVRLRVQYRRRDCKADCCCVLQVNACARNQLPRGRFKLAAGSIVAPNELFVGSI